MLPGRQIKTDVETALQAAGYHIGDFERIAVTGGRYRDLPEEVSGVPIVKVPEIEAIGRGGLLLAEVDRALVVSAGSGTALVAAGMEGSRHVTGSAVGGGTLRGLSALLLDTHDALEIDRLAAEGDANRVDLTLFEALGGAVGSLPADANAVNFGKTPEQLASATREDIAAGLIRLVAQVIAVITINAAAAAGMENIVFTGHLLDLPQIRQELHTVARYYQAQFNLPDAPGTGTVMGAMSWAFDRMRN